MDDCCSRCLSAPVLLSSARSLFTYAEIVYDTKGLCVGGQDRYLVLQIIFSCLTTLQCSRCLCEYAYVCLHTLLVHVRICFVMSTLGQSDTALHPVQEMTSRTGPVGSFWCRSDLLEDFSLHCC